MDSCRIDVLQKCSAQWDPQAQSTALRALLLSQACPTRGVHERGHPIGPHWNHFFLFVQKNLPYKNLSLEFVQTTDVTDTDVIFWKFSLGDPWETVRRRHRRPSVRRP